MVCRPVGGIGLQEQTCIGELLCYANDVSNPKGKYERRRKWARYASIYSKTFKSRLTYAMLIRTNKQEKYPTRPHLTKFKVPTAESSCYQPRRPSVPSGSGTLSPPPLVSPASPASSAGTPPAPASSDHARLSLPGVPSAPGTPRVAWDISIESGRLHYI